MSLIENCKIVRGCMGNGYKEISEPLTYEAAVAYLKMHQDEISDDDYEDGIDIIYIDSGRLASWSLR